MSGHKVICCKVKKVVLYKKDYNVGNKAFYTVKKGIIKKVKFVDNKSVVCHLVKWSAHKTKTL